MPIPDLDKLISTLEEQVSTAPYSEQQKLRPGVQRVIETLRAHGHVVPASLQRINKSLNEDAYEDAFDEMHENMPV